MVTDMVSFEAFRAVDGTPVYLQIINFIKRGAIAGTIRDGDELPSRRVLSALLGIKPELLHDYKSVELMFAVAEMRDKKLHDAAAGYTGCAAAGGLIRRTTHHGPHTAAAGNFQRRGAATH